MRFSFKKSHVRHFVRILQSFARIAEEVRLISSPDSIRFEIVKSPAVCADLTVSRKFFESYSEEEHIDVHFTSRSILLIFRKSHLLAKNLIIFDVTIQKDSDYAIFRQKMESYERISQIPFTSEIRVSELDFGDYERNPVKLRCLAKVLTAGLRHFPATIQLVTFRIRQEHVKVETGDEETIAEYMTQFRFHKEEFEDFVRNEDVTVTFSLKLLKQFLSAWDKNKHSVECFFKQDSNILFTTNCDGFSTRFMLARVMKDHTPNSPVRTGNETMLSTNVTTEVSGSMSRLNQSLTNPNLSLNQSATASVMNPPADDMEDEFEDDGMDAIISAMPCPEAGNQTAAAADVSLQDEANDSLRSVAGSAQFLHNVTTHVTQGHQSTQESFDPQVYRDLMLDSSSLIRDGRKIFGLDESVSHRIISNSSDVYSDDDSDQEINFDDV